MFSEKVLSFLDIKETLASYCSSIISKEMALALEVMVDRELVRGGLQETAEAIVSLQKETEQPLGGTRDIRHALTKAKKDALLAHEEIWDIYASLTAYKKCKQFFSEKYLQYPLLATWTQDMESHDALERKFKDVFDKKGNLLDTATPKLKQLRQSIQGTKDRLKKELYLITHDKDNQKYFQDTLVTQRNNRYVVPIKQEYRHVFPGIIHDKSATGSTLYIEPMVMVRLNNDLQEALLEEEREIIKIYRDLSQRIKAYGDSLLDSCRRVSHIEFVYGKGAYALSYSGIIGAINETRQVYLKNGRHPLLNPKTVVPTTIHLGKDYTILLITGSNTGGKTVALKTLGLLCLMHQSGLAIPADEETTLPIFRHIFADIGDEQSIEENLSTFSAHMKNICHIMKRAGEDDLILLDELGSGTDPEEGSALAVAIVEHFRRVGPLMMISTHYNELKNYAYETVGIENGHVEFDEQTLRPTYRLHIGVAGSSHALRIAERLGIPKTVIETAKRRKDSRQTSDIENILRELNEQVRMNEEKTRTLNRALVDAEEARRVAEVERKAIHEQRKTILNKAKDDAYNLKRSVRVESEKIIKELKNQFSQKDSKVREDTVGKARKNVEDITIPAVWSERRKKIKAAELHAGDFVFIKTLDTFGTVLSSKGNRIEVDVNGLSVSVKLSDAGHVTEDEQRTLRQRASTSQQEQSNRHCRRKNSAVQRQQEVRTEINVLGQTVDEGIMSVSRFIDQALLGGISTVRIIHGKGTGALRSGIRDFLNTLPSVLSFEEAGQNEGGAGATMVHLR